MDNYTVIGGVCLIKPSALYTEPHPSSCGPKPYGGDGGDEKKNKSWNYFVCFAKDLFVIKGLKKCTLTNPIDGQTKERQTLKRQTLDLTNPKQDKP